MDPNLLIVLAIFGTFALIVVVKLLMVFRTIKTVLRTARRGSVPGALGASAILGAQVEDAPDPDHPLLQSNTVKADTGSKLGSLVVFSLGWNLFSWPIAYMAASDPDREAGALGVVVFPLVGLGLLAFLFIRLTRHVRYRSSALVLGVFPPMVGGEVRGHISVPRGIPTQEGFTVRLGCYKEYWGTDSDGDRTRKSDLLWQTDQFITKPESPFTEDSTYIPIQLDIPKDAVSTTFEDANTQYVWKVRADADLAGVDFDVAFEIPVVPANGNLDPAPITATAGISIPVIEPAQMLDSPLVEDADAVRAVFPRKAMKASELMVLVGMTVAFGAATAVLLAADKGLFVPFMFGGVTGLLCWITLRRSLVASEISASQGVLTHKKTIFNEVVASYVGNEVSGLDVTMGAMILGKAYYQIRLTTSDGKVRTLAESIPSRPAAEQAVAALSERLGIEAQPTRFHAPTHGFPPRFSGVPAVEVTTTFDQTVEQPAAPEELGLANQVGGVVIPQIERRPPRRPGERWRVS